MAKTRGAGLLMVWVDIDAEHEAEVGRWYDDEQMPRVLEEPGILSGGRYAAVKGAPKQLVMYELDDHNVLHSAAYLTPDTRLPPVASAPRAAALAATSCATPIARSFPSIPTRSNRPAARRRFCRSGGSISARRWRRSSTTGTTPPISRPI
jgi:hypothetical protein